MGFRAFNPQKLSVQIDMKTGQGIELILDLLKHCDVVIENLRPGAVKRLGLGYEAVAKVKPDIVYVSMGMYGTQGPLRSEDHTSELKSIMRNSYADFYLKKTH